MPSPATLIILTGLLVAYGVVRSSPPRWRLLLWIVVILGATVPWGNWHPQVRWDRVTWVPFSSEVTSFRPRDVLVNLLLYWPLGLFLRPQRPLTWGLMAAACCLGLGLSLGAEGLQAFSRRRFPSATDVAMNTVGTCLGALTARRRQPSDRPR